MTVNRSSKKGRTELPEKRKKGFEKNRSITWWKKKSCFLDLLTCKTFHTGSNVLGLYERNMLFVFLSPTYSHPEAVLQGAGGKVSSSRLDHICRHLAPLVAALAMVSTYYCTRFLKYWYRAKIVVQILWRKTKQNKTLAASYWLCFHLFIHLGGVSLYIEKRLWEGKILFQNPSAIRVRDKMLGKTRENLLQVPLEILCMAVDISEKVRTMK